MFCDLISLPFAHICKSNIYNMTHDNSNSSSDKLRQTEFPGFSTLKPFDMDRRKKVSDKNFCQHKGF